MPLLKVAVGVHVEPLNPGNMADMARPAQQLWRVAAELIYLSSPPRALLKVTPPTEGTGLSNSYYRVKLTKVQFHMAT